MKDINHLPRNGMGAGINGTIESKPGIMVRNIYPMARLVDLVPGLGYMEGLCDL